MEPAARQKRHRRPKSSGTTTVVSTSTSAIGAGSVQLVGSARASRLDSVLQRLEALETKVGRICAAQEETAAELGLLRAKAVAVVKEEEAKDEEAEPEVPSNFYTLALVRAVTARSTPVSLLWALGALFQILVEIVCLWSVAISSSWSKCVSTEDCKTGLICLKSWSAYMDTTYQVCEQCNYRNWGNMSKGDEASGDISDLDTYCLGMLDDAYDAGLLQEAKPEFDNTFCLYALENFAKVSALEWSVLHIAFFLVSLSVVKERQEQCRNTELRRAVLPLFPPWAQWRQRPAGRQLVAWIFSLTELLADCLLLVLVPFTMLLLLVNSGLQAANALLNGVAIAFAVRRDASNAPKLPALTCASFLRSSKSTTSCLTSARASGRRRRSLSKR